MIRTTKRQFLSTLAGAAALAAGLPSTALAQAAFPTRPVKIVVPYPPGGSVDPVARLVAQKLTDLWGQQVVVDNRPGASTIIGTDVVAKAAPDGYTLLLTASTHVSNPLLFPSLPYDSFKDFTPVAPLYLAEFVLVAHPSVKANTLQEFIAEAKANPGKYSYASAGPGNANHMGMELFSMMTGTKMLHVPYKGGGPLVTDLLSGQVQLYLAVPVTVIPHLQSGKLKALGTTSDKRLALMPNVPTFTEAGLPGFGMKSWLGILAPAHTPRDIVLKLNGDFAKVLAMPEVRDKLLGQGQLPYVLTPDQFATVMKDDTAEFARVIKAANIKLDQ
jgi:tripartite-type tricarboxylate transporter receptor subunit TctC